MNKQENSIATRAFIAMILGGIMIAFSPIFMRYSASVSDISPTAAAFWRVALALPLLLGILFIQRKNQPDFPIASVFKFNRHFLVVGFFFAADMAFWHWSVAFTTVANSTLLANMASIFTALIGYLFFKERFSKQFMLGISLAILGAIALMGHSLEANPDNLFGDMLGVITALGYAGYIIATNKARKKFSTIALMLGSGLVTIIFLAPVMAFEPKAIIPATLIGWWPILGLSWISHLLGQSLIMYGLAHLSAAMGSVSLLIQPVVAALLANIIFGENLVIYHLIGGILIISGILTCKKGQKAP